MIFVLCAVFSDDPGRVKYVRPLGCIEFIISQQNRIVNAFEKHKRINNTEFSL